MELDGEGACLPLSDSTEIYQDAGASSEVSGQDLPSGNLEAEMELSVQLLSCTSLRYLEK